MHFAQAKNRVPLRPKLLMFVGEGIFGVSGRTVKRKGEYRDLHEEQRFWLTQFKPSYGGVIELIMPEENVTESRAIETILRGFKKAMQTDSALLSVTTLNTHVAQEVLQMLLSMGFGELLVVLHYQKDEKVNIGFVENGQFVAEKPFDFKPEEISPEVLKRISLVDELEVMLGRKYQQQEAAKSSQSTETYGQARQEELV